MTLVCRRCKTPLVAGDNWRQAFVRKAYYRCTPCEKLSMATWREKNQEHIKQYTQQYRKDRIRRERTHNGWDWALTREEHRAFTDSPCFYCRGPLNPTGTALDRIDSAVGYLLHNVVPCCRRCNRMKSDLLTSDEMLLLWAIRRGEVINPLIGETYMPDGMNWVNDANTTSK